MSTTTLPLTAIEQEALTDTYNDVRLLIYKVVHYFVARSGLSFEEVLGEAHLTFVRSYRGYQPDRFAKRCRFPTFLYFALNCELYNFTMKQQKHRNLPEVKEEMVGKELPSRFVLLLESELKQEARGVLRLFLNTPQELEHLMRWDQVRSPKAYLRSVREYLAILGWSKRQVREVMEEIKHAISQLSVTQRRLPCTGVERMLARAGLSEDEVWLLTRIDLSAQQVRSCLARR